MSKETADGCNGRNGIELYRLVCYEIDAVFNNADFHLGVAIQRLGEKRCKTLEDSRELVRKLDTIAKEYQEKVGQVVPGKLLAKSFWQAVDEQTLELAGNKNITFGEGCYKELRAFALQRFENKQARCPAPARDGLAAVGESGQDKSKEEAQNEPEEDTLNSTKGKGKGKCFECWACGGKGHPQRLCPTPPGSSAAHTCNTCGGKGHMSAECTSGKGGKSPKGAPKGGNWKGTKGKSWGKGYKGKGKGPDKGKGKGLYGLDYTGDGSSGWIAWGADGWDSSWHWGSQAWGDEWPKPDLSGQPWMNTPGLASMAAPPGFENARRLSMLTEVEVDRTLTEEPTATAQTTTIVEAKSQKTIMVLGRTEGPTEVEVARALAEKPTATATTTTICEAISRKTTVVFERTEEPTEVEVARALAEKPTAAATTTTNTTTTEGPTAATTTTTMTTTDSETQADKAQNQDDPLATSYLLTSSFRAEKISPRGSGPPRVREKRPKGPRPQMDPRPRRGTAGVQFKPNTK